MRLLALLAEFSSHCVPADGGHWKRRRAWIFHHRFALSRFSFNIFSAFVNISSNFAASGSVAARAGAEG